MADICPHLGLLSEGKGGRREAFSICSASAAIAVEKSRLFKSDPDPKSCRAQPGRRPVPVGSARQRSSRVTWNFLKPPELVCLRQTLRLPLNRAILLAVCGLWSHDSICAPTVTQHT